MESGSLFFVNISLFADEESGLLPRLAATENLSLGNQMKS